MNWGEAYRKWFNEWNYEDYGYEFDRWHLGMVIFGDPMLTLSGDTTEKLEAIETSLPTTVELEALTRIQERWAAELELDTFADYRSRHPQFFK